MGPTQRRLGHSLHRFGRFFHPPLGLVLLLHHKCLTQLLDKVDVLPQMMLKLLQLFRHLLVCLNLNCLTQFAIKPRQRFSKPTVHSLKRICSALRQDFAQLILHRVAKLRI